jgi:hypothetical protein
MKGDGHREGEGRRERVWEREYGRESMGERVWGREHRRESIGE